jgi:hypothetical protein
MKWTPEQIAVRWHTKQVEITSENDDIFGDVRVSGTLNKIIGVVCAIRDAIPEASRSTAMAEFSCDEGHREFLVSYERPETDAEVAIRLERECTRSATEARRLARIEQEERDELARLKAKYEGWPGAPATENTK